MDTLFPFSRFSHYLKYPKLLYADLTSNIRWMFQRAFRGYDDRVLWSIDEYLSDMLPIWITQLRDNGMGIPSEIFKPEDYSDECYNVPDEVFEHRREEWKIILTKIIEGFKATEIIYHPYGLLPEEVKEAERKFSVGMDLFKKYYFGLWD